MSWNDVSLDGPAQDEDSRVTLTPVNTDVSSPLFEGVVKTTGTSGYIIPRIAKTTSGGSSATIYDAVMEVL